MKKIKHLVFGLVSSLLLAAGFARAADKLDPLSANLAERAEHALKAAPGCTYECDAMVDLKASPGCTYECDAVLNQE